MPAPSVLVTEIAPFLPPDDVFAALVADPHPFFLHSGLKMPRIGRYSMAGSDPFLVMTSKGPWVTIRQSEGVSVFQANPFHELRRLLRAYPLPRHPQVPFVGGAVGYLSYDLCHFVERLPCTALDDISMPDLYLAFHDTAVIFDHQDGRAWAVAADMHLPGRTSARERTGRLIERLSAPTPTMKTAASAAEAAADIRCNFTRDEYLAAVQRSKDYIAAGDIFQVNLSRRLETRLSVPPHELFLRLCRINPAPMSAYLAFDDCAIVSASPERFLRVSNRHVETRPIKGTRPRGATPEEDAALMEELLSSEKDGAELAMIVDLERNDLGRVCSYGTVRVTQPKVLESFPTVHHLVATVEGDLHDGYDLVDLLRATFPGGSITGAPKIRAMEIIDELEPTRRSVYTGAVGYLGFDGSMDLNIVIRTFIVHRDRAWFQVGGGIVADSDLCAEYDETHYKARALIEAVSAADHPMPETVRRDGWHGGSCPAVRGSHGRTRPAVPP